MEAERYEVNQCEEMERMDHREDGHVGWGRRCEVPSAVPLLPC